MSVDQMRASDADRNQVMAVLVAAYDEGRLSDDEYASRAARAAGAVTIGSLIELTQDLVPMDDLLWIGSVHPS